MSESQKMALRMAVVYALIGVAWILLSDILVSRVVRGELQAQIQSVKGFAFVLVTASVMYVLVERLGSRLLEETQRVSSTERMLRQVVGTVPVGVLLTADGGVVTFLNSAAERLFGTSARDAIGKSAGVLFGDGERGEEIVAELTRLGALDGLAIGGRGDSPARSVIARAAAVDPDASESRWVIAVADVTEAHEARAEAERLVGAYRFMVEIIDVAARSDDVTDLLRNVAESAVRSGRYRAAWVVRIGEDETPRFEDVARLGMGARAQETASMMQGWADGDASRVHFAPGAFMVSNDILRDPTNVWHSAALEDGFGSSITFGVGTDDELVAGVTLFAEEVGAFDTAELDMLSRLLDAVDFQVARIQRA